MEGRGCPLKFLHSAWGSGNQPSEVHCAQTISPWTACTWILGIPPRPVGRDASCSLHNHQCFHQKSTDIENSSRDWDFFTDYLLCVIFICSMLPLLPECTGQNKKGPRMSKTLLYSKISVFSSLCLCPSFCLCPSLSTSASLFLDWLRKGREKGVLNWTSQESLPLVQTY